MSTPRRDHTRLLIGLVVVLLVGYLVLMARNGLAATFGGGGLVGLGLGIGMLVMVAVGGWIVVATVLAGFAHQRLSARAAEEGCELDIADLPRMPSGRVRRDAADALFDEVRAEWEKNPDDWRTTYRVARAYDHAGDRSRARAQMRRAVDLERAERRSSSTTGETP